jgi:hypothetical protein
MPYSNVKEVPDYVPKENRAQWREVWNGAYAAAIKDGKGKKEAEQSAFAQANSVSGPNAKSDKETIMKSFSKFIPFAKVDAARREVWGIVTAEVPDKDDEVCDYLLSKPYYQAVIDEMGKATAGENYFPLRYMHQLEAVGKCIGFDFRDADKEIFMGFKVVDDQAWQKVEERVLTGFSHGGKIVGMHPDPKFEGCKRYVADPSEISLVDNPCLASAHFTHIKADGTVELCKFLRVEPVAPGRLEAVERSLALLKMRLSLGKSDESLDQRRTAVQAAIQDDYSELSNDPAQVQWAYLRELFDDHAIFGKEGKLFSVPYTIDDKQNVKLGAPTQVQVEYLPAGKAAGAALVKVKTKRVAGEDLPASAFLIVLDPDKTETWNLPVRFSSEKKSKSHVRNALARFNQLKGVPQAAKDAAWKKLVALAGKYDIDVATEKAKLAAIQAWMRKAVRTHINQLSRTVKGGNIGYALATLDNDLGRLAKGFSQVSQLSQIVEALAYLVYSTAGESEMEGDDSPLPGLLADNVDAILDTLLRMVEEESEEVRADLSARVS